MGQRAINEDAVVSQRADLVSTDLDGETVMMSIEQGKYYGLDEVGSRIWELIAEPKRVLDVVAILTQEYEVGQQECESDTMEFLNHLHSEGLVQID